MFYLDMAQCIDIQVNNNLESAQRLAEFIAMSGRGKAEIARLARVDPATISRILSASQPMGPKVIAGLMNAFDVNQEWLEKGQGEVGSLKLKPGVEEEIQKGKGVKSVSPKAEKALLFLSDLPEENAEDYVPYYDIEVTAGRIEVYFDDEVDETPAGYLYAPQYRGCAMFHLKGDSMYDRIFPGSRMYVWYMKDKKYIEFGQIFLVVLPGERLLKYIFPHPTDPALVLLRSHNSDKYPDIPVEKIDIIHLFKVKGYENQNAL